MPNFRSEPLATAATAVTAAPGFSRPTFASINLAALRDNTRCLAASLSSGTSLIAVVKANAYGHGAVPVARALMSLESACRPLMLAVASVDEGAALREAGIAAPILLLSALLTEEAETAVQHDLHVTLFSPEMAGALDDAARRQNKMARAHLKIDTGMGRLGIGPQPAAALFAARRQWRHLRIDGLYTHFACADEADPSLTLLPCKYFEAAWRDWRAAAVANSSDANSSDGAATKLLIHAANSAAAWRFPETHFDAVRAGLSLYGIFPSAITRSDALQRCGETVLQPVMRLQSRVAFLKPVPTGTAISYGSTWRAARPSLIATVPIGYADGYPRCLSNRAQVLINGQRAPLAGRVTMDQILVDCTDIQAQAGDEVVLWGDENLPIETVAQWAQTIPYELMCGVAPRVPRVYRGDDR